MRCLGLHSKEPLFGRLHVGTWMILPGNVMCPAEGVYMGLRDARDRAFGGHPRRGMSQPPGREDEISDIRAHA